MTITIRIKVPDNAYGRNVERELTTAWLNDDVVSIATPNYTIEDVEITYVKSR